MKVVVGVAPAVAGQDAQHQVDAAAEAGQDDMCGADGEPQLVTEEDNNDKLDDLDEKIEHVDENDTFLSLSVGLVQKNINGNFLDCQKIRPNATTSKNIPQVFF